MGLAGAEIIQENRGKLAENTRRNIDPDHVGHHGPEA